MSVTNSNAKSAVKTSRKAKNAASASNTVLSAVLAQTEEQHVPLSALVKSPQNVRIVPYSAESVRELADSIKGIGLLQNLVVHALPDGLYGVAAGGRRLAAMNLLATENTIHPDWPVRVKVVPDNLATTASLTENGQHLEIAFAFHLRDWWQPTKADFFTGLKKPQIIAALNEAGLTGAARDAEKMKKGDAAELAEDKMRDNRWVPVWMRAPDAENGSADADSHHTLPDAA
ncbi:hypothetical protein ABM58_003941 [Salmonella enterica subsp. enterica]|nr:hypothetical protein [Salmonella enterica subsp. enterica serovar Manchester]EDG5395300.1 hypothetical protein [Salmonella enterica subsp. enterica serovar Bovismorbificans]EEA7774278.1 hypothetical protein [Salmonella enterica subsp. enterica serovar Manchester]